MQFIRNALKDGVPLNTLKKQLEERGWSDEAVNEAVDVAIPSDDDSDKQEETGDLENLELKQSTWGKVKGLLKKKCPYCSSEVASKDEFCPSCGRRLREEEKKEQQVRIVIDKQSESVKIEEQPPKEPASLFKIIWDTLNSFAMGILLAIAVILVIFFAGIFLKLRPDWKLCSTSGAYANQMYSLASQMLIFTGINVQYCDYVNFATVFSIVIIILAGSFIAYYSLLEIYKGFRQVK